MTIRKYDRCLNCGAPLESGRSDKKYCSSKCKNTFNNEHRDVDLTLAKFRTMYILNKNYNILSEALLNDCNSIDIGDLVQAGFNPEYATSIKKASNGFEMRCFDIKYRQTDHKIYNIATTSTAVPFLEFAPNM